MPLELKQELKLQQKLVITQQLQQVIKLLQYNRYELMQQINKELSENPVLEEGEVATKEEAESDAMEEARGAREEKMSEEDEKRKEDNSIDWERFLENHSFLSPIPWNNNFNSDDEGWDWEQVANQPETLVEHLLWQLRLDSLDERSRRIGAYLIGNLNEDGYLSNDDTLEKARELFEATPDELETVRRIIMGYDPLGCGSFTLMECLESQAAIVYPNDEKLQRLIKNHLEDIEHRRFSAISRALRIDDDGLKKLIERLRTLEPHPGRSYSSQEPIGVIPDVFVEKIGSDYFVRLNNDGIPHLRISGYYHKLLKDSVDQQTKEIIRENLNRAHLFIRGISQRQSNILRVMEKVVERQKEFFDYGIKHLKPMILKDIADELNLHPSTISRVTASKYAHTPRGTFEIKFFFSKAVPQSDPSLSPLSAAALHFMINEIIKEEPKEKPFSDAEICEKIKEKYNVSVLRRTLSKHRSEIGILSASRRTSF
ncbi:MAG: RNA polymerase factor sigma-54 [Myxococcota bacterium]